VRGTTTKVGQFPGSSFVRISTSASVASASSSGVLASTIIPLGTNSIVIPRCENDRHRARGSRRIVSAGCEAIVRARRRRLILPSCDRAERHATHLLGAESAAGG